MGVWVGCHSLTSSASELAEKMLLSVTPDSSCEPASETETLELQRRHTDRNIVRRSSLVSSGSEISWFVLYF